MYDCKAWNTKKAQVNHRKDEAISPESMIRFVSIHRIMDNS